MAGNETDVFFTGIRVHQGGLKVKYGAFIYAVLRDSPMDNALLDQYHVTCLGQNLPVVQIQAQKAALHLYQLHFFMPVEGHVVAGMMLVHMIKGDGKVRGPVFYLFIIIQIMHSCFPPQHPWGAAFERIRFPFSQGKGKLV